MSVLYHHVSHSLAQGLCLGAKILCQTRNGQDQPLAQEERCDTGLWTWGKLSFRETWDPNKPFIYILTPVDSLGVELYQSLPGKRIWPV